MTGGIPKSERNLALVNRYLTAKATKCEKLNNIYIEFNLSKQRAYEIIQGYLRGVAQHKVSRSMVKGGFEYVELTDEKQAEIMLKVKRRLEFLGRYSNNDLRGSIQEARYTSQKSVEVEG